MKDSTGRTYEVRPIGPRVLIKRLSADERSKGGIIIPDTAKERPTRGEVLAVGAGRILDNGERVDIPLKRGDHVIFAAYAGVEVKIEGETCVVIHEDDLLAKVDTE